MLKAAGSPAEQTPFPSLEDEAEKSGGAGGADALPMFPALSPGFWLQVPTGPSTPGPERSRWCAPALEGDNS